MLPPNASARPAVRTAGLGRYAAAVAVTVLAVVSQYFVPPLLPASRVVYGNLPGDLFVVYGLPVLAFALLVGGAPLRDWRSRIGLATWEGLRWYGLLSLLALLVTFLLLIVYAVVDPGALALLNRPNPALEQARGNPWFYVGFSFVIGAFEETIFRGWIFGYWRDRATGWVAPATWTSVLFAGVHLYYGTTYGIASPVIFPSLFFLGFALAATYRYSGGNLVVPAVLHGAHDAFSFLTLVLPTLGVALEYGLILVGGLVGLIAYVRRTPPALSPIVGSGGPPG